jgi:hypothetical protein
MRSTDDPEEKWYECEGECDYEGEDGDEYEC